MQLQTLGTILDSTEMRMSTVLLDLLNAHSLFLATSTSCHEV